MIMATPGREDITKGIKKRPLKTTSGLDRTAYRVFRTLLELREPQPFS
jgi:hypothetical protein